MSIEGCEYCLEDVCQDCFDEHLADCPNSWNAIQDELEA